MQSGGGGLQSLVGRVMCRGSECGGPWVSATCEELDGFTGLSDRVDWGSLPVAGVEETEGCYKLPPSLLHLNGIQPQLLFIPSYSSRTVTLP